MDGVKISVLVPCYNSEEYVAQTLDSVLAQTFSDWECIVADDGSTDTSVQIVESYCKRDKRFKLIRQSNLGPGAARNLAASHARGEFLLPLDSDDLIGPEYMRKALAAYENDPSLKLVYCKAELFGTEEGPWPLPEYKYEDFIFVNCIFISSVFRKSDFVAAGGYDEGMRSGYEDWEFLLRFLKPEDKVFRIDNVLFKYRRKPVSVNSTALEKEKELKREIVRKHPEIYDSYREDIIDMGRRILVLENEVKTLQAKLKKAEGRNKCPLKRIFEKISR